MTFCLQHYDVKCNLNVNVSTLADASIEPKTETIIDLEPEFHVKTSSLYLFDIISA